MYSLETLFSGNLDKGENLVERLMPPPILTKEKIGATR